MHLSLAVSSFLLLSVFQSNIIVESLDSATYYAIKDDLEKFNVTCADNCQSNVLNSRSAKDCECGEQCAEFGTCCFDSFYINRTQSKVKAACRNVQNGYAYYIVDQCASKDSVWANLCNDDNYDSQTGDENIRKIVPVTSRRSSITYKNYYCFRCHETTDEFLSWSVQVAENPPQRNIDRESSQQSPAEDERMSIVYSKEMNSWTASLGANYSYVPVKITMRVPDKIDRITHKCIKDIISDCSDEWSDEDTRKKCQSYMAIKRVKNNTSIKLYKDIHCALCNFENSNDIACRPKRKRRFSFAHFMDMNRSDGESLDKFPKCSDERIWDPFLKRCRKLKCALPRYVVKSGKCLPE